MTNNYIQIGNEYRLTGIGGPDSNFYQVWKQISGGSYRKCNLQITVLNKIDFIKTQDILYYIVKQFVDKKLNSGGYVVSPDTFREFNELTTDGIINIAMELNPDETITVFHKTK